MQGEAAHSAQDESFFISEAEVCLEPGNAGVVGRGALGDMRRNY